MSEQGRPKLETLRALYLRAEEAYQEMAKAAPKQKEDLGDGISMEWETDPNAPGGWRGHAGRDGGGWGGPARWPITSLRRLLEIREALDAWAAGTGEWPLARKPDQSPKPMDAA